MSGGEVVRGVPVVALGDGAALLHSTAHIVDGSPLGAHLGGSWPYFPPATRCGLPMWGPWGELPRSYLGLVPLCPACGPQCPPKVVRGTLDGLVLWGP